MRRGRAISGIVRAATAAPVRLASVRLAAVWLVLAGLAAPAAAGVFLRPEGTGRIIMTAIHTNSPRGFDDRGQVVDIADYKQDQLYVNAEYGVTSSLTAIFTPSYRGVSVEGGDSTKGLGYTDIGGRYRLLQSGGFLVSGQALLRIPGKRRADRAAQIGSTSTDVDLRLGAAYGTQSFFTSGEAGYRLRSGDLPNEYHLDATFGVRPAPKFLLIASSYNTFSDGEGRGVFNDSYRYGDLFLSGVVEVNPAISLQAGYTATIYGKNALRQRGPTVGLWINF